MQEEIFLMIAVTVSVTDLGLASELNAGGCRLLAYVTCSKFIWYYNSINQSNRFYNYYTVLYVINESYGKLVTSSKFAVVEIDL